MLKIPKMPIAKCSNVEFLIFECSTFVARTFSVFCLGKNRMYQVISNFQFCTLH